MEWLIPKWVHADLYRYTGKAHSWRTFWKGMGYPGFRFTYFFRQASFHPKTSPLGLFFRMAYERYFWIYGYQIPLKTEIGEGLYIGHLGHIVINGLARLGRNCNLAPGVTIGQANRGRRKGCPRIGDNVWIGTNAVVVGRITIGNNVLIAPGAFVNTDVPDNSIVVGNPAKVTPNDQATAGYVERVMDAPREETAARPGGSGGEGQGPEGA